MFRLYTWPLVAALSLFSQGVFAEEPESQTTAAAENTAATGDFGVRVFIDEQTGAVRSPTEAETAAMAEQFRRRFIDLAEEKPPVYHADGSVSKELGSRYHMYTVARISGDGGLEAQCLPAEQAADFLADDAQKKPAAEIDTVDQGAQSQ